MCEKYATWKREMEAAAKERRQKLEGEWGACELDRERKEWLRSRGYKVRMGER